MILLSTSTDTYQLTESVINSEARLNELVSVSNSMADAVIHIDGHIIQVRPDWKNSRPPVLFPELEFTPGNLLAVVYALLGNTTRALSFLENDADLHDVIRITIALQQGLEIPDTFFREETAYYYLHNKAVAAHFGSNLAFEKIKPLYLQALAAAPDATSKAFTGKQYTLLLEDTGAWKEAGELINQWLPAVTDEDAYTALLFTSSSIRMQQLISPYPEQWLQQLKEDLWKCLAYFEKNNRHTDIAQTLYEAAQVALISESYSEALGYINRSIGLFAQEEMPELTAQAELRKGHILAVWAKNGNPQFYKTAAQAFQEALKVFSRESTPAIFADIHHQLGIIYAEIPDEIKKKGVWASVAVASFNEALNYYNKVDHPFRFGLICNSMGTAYTQFPAAIHSDNYDKALAWYREALDVYPAALYPEERAGVLLNYLDASWYAGNTDAFNEERFEEMISKAEEVIRIPARAEQKNMARLQLEKLAALKTEIEAVEQPAADTGTKD